MDRPDEHIINKVLSFKQRYTCAICSLMLTPRNVVQTSCCHRMCDACLERMKGMLARHMHVKIRFATVCKNNSSTYISTSLLLIKDMTTNIVECSC